MDKRRGKNISLCLKLFIVFMVAITGGEYGSVKALQMKNPAITAGSDILAVGVPVKLTCNYFKFMTEKIRKITWYAGYDGMSSKILEHQVNGITKSNGVYSWINVNVRTATADELTITLPEFRENKMVVKCEVNARSETSGRIRLITKAGEAELGVADVNSPQLNASTSFERHAEAVHSHLLEMMDPARHVHPGIPYDFYSGYVVVEAENLDGSGYPYGSAAEKTIVLGQLPQKVRRKLENERGSYQYFDDNKIIMKLNAVKVLNLLGSMDYRVIGNSSPDKKKVLWTLERKDFEKLQDL